MSHRLFRPVTDPAIRHTHFFEGQVLTADALRSDQVASRAQRRLLGRALGAGVVEGLEVSAPTDLGDQSGKVLRVRAGLAVNRTGDALHLPIEVDVPISVPQDDAPTRVHGFTACEKVGDQTLITVANDPYVLVLCPTATYAGRAPKAGFEGGKVSSCGSRYEVAGVELRLVRVRPESLVGLWPETKAELAAFKLAVSSEIGLNGGAASFDPVQVSRARNLLAHACFGTEAQLDGSLPTPPPDPGEPYRPRYGALDQLAELDPCDVPLALFYWGQGVVFLDMWSVRRSAYVEGQRSAAEVEPVERRRSEGRAMFEQFQRHIADLAFDPTVDNATLRARDYFRFLPPLGQLETASGLGTQTFFDGFPLRSGTAVHHTEGAPVETPGLQYLDRRLVLEATAESFLHAAIDLARDLHTERPPEMVWTYATMEPRPSPSGAVDDLRVTTRRVFAAAPLGPHATARFDVSRWDLSNFASGATGEP